MCGNFHETHCPATYLNLIQGQCLALNSDRVLQLRGYLLDTTASPSFLTPCTSRQSADTTTKLYQYAMTSPRYKLVFYVICQLLTTFGATLIGKEMITLTPLLCERARSPGKWGCTMVLASLPKTVTPPPR